MLTFVVVAAPAKTDAPTSGKYAILSNKIKVMVGKIYGFPPYLYMESIDQNCKFSQFRIIINCRKLRSRLFQEQLNLCTDIVRQLVVPFRLFIIKLLAKIFSRVMQQLLNEPSRLFQ